VLRGTARKLAKHTLKGALGNPRWQGFWETLHTLSLAGMNIGGGGGVGDSGERWVMEHVAKHLRQDRPVTVFDVGANVGSFSRELARRLGPDARIFAFEPAGETYRSLIRNLEGVRGVEAFNFAFGETEGVIKLYSDEPGSGLASTYRRRLDHFGIAMDTVEEVPVKTIDGFCAEQGINSIDFLKLDVEGHEMAVLSGARGVLESGAVDFIQFEFGGCNIDSRTFFQDFYYLLSPRYQLYRIVSGGIVPIERYKEKYEAFITTNYLAVRRRILAAL
jgi:FkbM family methyltransferase